MVFRFIFFSFAIFPELIRCQNSDVQKTQETEKESELNKKREKEKLKEQELERLKRLENITVDLDTVATFPNDYIGKKTRVKNAQVSEIKSLNVQGELYYFIKVHSYSGKLFSTDFFKDEIAFIADSATARLINEYYRKTNKKEYDQYVVNMIFRLESVTQGTETYYLAAVDCIEFLGLNKIVNSIGKCEIN